MEGKHKIGVVSVSFRNFHWKGDKKLPLADAVTEWRRYLNKFSAPRTLLLEFMPNGTIEELVGEANALRSIIGENI